MRSTDLEFAEHDAQNASAASGGTMSGAIASFAAKETSPSTRRPSRAESIKDGNSSVSAPTIQIPSDSEQLNQKRHDAYQGQGRSTTERRGPQIRRIDKRAWAKTVEIPTAGHPAANLTKYHPGRITDIHGSGEFRFFCMKGCAGYRPIFATIPRSWARETPIDATSISRESLENHGDLYRSARRKGAPPKSP